MKMERVVIGLGSNMPDGESKLRMAMEVLSGLLSCQVHSDIYATKPLSGKGPDYRNAVLMGETSLTFEDLNTELKRLETDSGRDASAREHGEVPLDLDIVIYGDKTIRPRDFRQEYFQKGYRSIIKQS